jgi:hypothetical protein
VKHLEKQLFDGTNVLTGRALADDVIDVELQSWRKQVGSYRSRGFK